MMPALVGVIGTVAWSLLLALVLRGVSICWLLLHAAYALSNTIELRLRL
jgi:hypothetical protein